MGYGHLDLKNNPNRNKDYFCSVCGAFNDPFNCKDWHDQLIKNICGKCKVARKNLI